MVTHIEGLLDADVLVPGWNCSCPEVGKTVPCGWCICLEYSWTMDAHRVQELVKVRFPLAGELEVCVRVIFALAVWVQKQTHTAAYPFYASSGDEALLDCIGPDPYGHWHTGDRFNFIGFWRIQQMLDADGRHCDRPGNPDGPLPRINCTSLVNGVPVAESQRPSDDESELSVLQELIETVMAAPTVSPADPPAASAAVQGSSSQGFGWGSASPGPASPLYSPGPASPVLPSSPTLSQIHQPTLPGTLGFSPRIGVSPISRRRSPVARRRSPSINSERRGSGSRAGGQFVRRSEARIALSDQATAAALEDAFADGGSSSSGGAPGLLR